VVGGLWGLAWGPFAPLCIPIGAGVGAAAGTAAGAAAGLTGALTEEKASRLRERVSHVEHSHDLQAELQKNITDRALRYWRLDARPAPTIVTVELLDLELTSTRDERVSCAVTVLVSVSRRGAAPSAARQKTYEYASSFSSLSVWLDEENDFFDTSLSNATQQIAAQIVSELAVDERVALNP